MIDGHLLETWLNRSLRFANLPKDFSDATADEVLRGIDRSEREAREASPLDRLVAENASEEVLDHPWHHPEDIPLPVALRREIQSRLTNPSRRYQFLQALWNYFLGRLVEGRYREDKAELARLQDICERLSMNERGESNLSIHRGDSAPFGFDVYGEPQLSRIDAVRPEGLLSVVGAELISSHPAFEISVCRGIGCGRYLKRPLPRKPHGQSKYCEDCRSTEKSTIYVKRHRSENPPKKLAKAKHK
jgi:hypothetical protein